MLHFHTFNNEPEDIKNMKALYFEAFPEDERAPFEILLDRANQGKGKFTLFFNEDQNFLGMVYLVYGTYFNFIFYLAVVSKYRSLGYGTEILNIMKDLNEDKALALNIEPVDKNASNYLERVRREAFYLRNGFADLGYQTKDGGLYFEMFSYNGYVKKEDYIESLRNFFGNELYESILERYGRE